MSTPVVVYLGFGANLGDRRRTILHGLRALSAHPEVIVSRTSTFIETRPVGSPDGQEHPPFLNAAARVSTILGPRALLGLCLSIETALGRDRRTERRWGPRRLDIDLLLYGHDVIDEAGLTVPHPRMPARWFVLAPLAEIAPRVEHPVLRRSIESLLRDVVPTPAHSV